MFLDYPENALPGPGGLSVGENAANIEAGYLVGIALKVPPLLDAHVKLKSLCPQLVFYRRAHGPEVNLNVAKGHWFA